MKSHSIIWTTVVLLLFGMSSCSDRNGSNSSPQQSDDNPLIGAWEFLYSESIYADTTYVLDSTHFQSVYLINKDHFSFTTTSVDSNQLLYAGYGRYSLDENGEYIEHVEFHSSPDVIGLAVKFKSKVEGDIWMHEGNIPLNERNVFQRSINGGKDQYILREYRRRLQ